VDVFEGVKSQVDDISFSQVRTDLVNLFVVELLVEWDVECLYDYHVDEGCRFLATTTDIWPFLNTKQLVVS
jgi:hypothetical protein